MQRKTASMRAEEALCKSVCVCKRVQIRRKASLFPWVLRPASNWSIDGLKWSRNAIKSFSYPSHSPDMHKNLPQNTTNNHKPAQHCKERTHKHWQMRTHTDRRTDTMAQKAGGSRWRCWLWSATANNGLSRSLSQTHSRGLGQFCEKSILSAWLPEVRA